MVDRIVPATTPADLDALEAAHGYRDAAAVGGEPFRQWVIEDRFAGRRPPWDLAGAEFVADVTPFEHLKMRVLNAAQSTLAYLGVLAGHAHTFDAVADPAPRGLHPRHARRPRASRPSPASPAPTRAPTSTASLARLANTRDPPPLPPDRHRRLAEAAAAPRQPGRRAARPRPAGRRASPSPSPPGWPGSSAPPTASAASGRPTTPRPRASPPSPTATGDDPPALVAGILALDTVFAPALAARDDFRAGLAAALAGLLGPDPMAVVRQIDRETP